MSDIKKVYQIVHSDEEGTYTYSAVFATQDLAETKCLELMEENSGIDYYVTEIPFYQN